MSKLAFKVALLAAVFLSVSLALGTLLHGPLQGRLDPRRSIFFGTGHVEYGLVLMGDSVFGSYYVDRPDQALWSRLQQLSGRRTLPGALNAARSADVLAAARFLAPRLSRGTIVFVDVPPFKVWERGEGIYGYEFGHYAGFLDEPLSAPKRAWNAVIQPVVTRMLLWRDAPLLASALFQRRHFDKGEYHDRRWDRPPDYARQRFQLWVETFESGEATREGDLSMLGEIGGVLERQGHHPVFVLTPLNRDLVARFAERSLSGRIDAHLRARHARTLAYLRARGLASIDLVDAVAAEGFADLAHTNVVGDEVMARAMAAYVAGLPAAQPTGPGSGLPSGR